MRDAEVVASIVAGYPDGLAAAYDRYADPLYTYCRSIVPDPADAADAVQDTFVLAASRIESLRDPEKFRAWLYAIARNECLRVLRDKKRIQAMDGMPEMADAGSDVSAGFERAEKVRLVQAALGGLNPSEREVMELQLRHDLDPGEMANVLGLSRPQLRTLLSRARDQLEAGLAVLLVGRTGRRDCGELDQMLSNWDGSVTVLLRKRVNRHIEHCDTCTSRRAMVLAPAAILEGAGGLALVAAPAALRATVLHVALGTDPASVACRALVAKAAGLDKGGFPRPIHVKGAMHHAPWHSQAVGRAVMSANVAALIAVIAAGAAFSLTSNDQKIKLSAAAPPPSWASSAPTSRAHDCRECTGEFSQPGSGSAGGMDHDHCKCRHAPGSPPARKHGHPSPGRPRHRDSRARPCPASTVTVIGSSNRGS